MPVSLSITAVTATSVQIGITAVPLGASDVEIQYGIFPNWQFCIAPLFRTGAASTTYTLQKLNQLSRYFIRARAILASGAPDLWSDPVAAFTGAGAARDLTLPGIVITPTLIVPSEPVIAWTSVNDVAGHPSRAMGRDDPSSQWWASGGAVSFEMQIAGAPVDTLGLFATNAPEDATVVVTADDTLAGARSGSPAYATSALTFRASPSLPARPGYHCFVRLPAPQSYRFWRMAITATTPGNIFAATYAAIGLARFTKNLSADKTETPTDSGSLSRDRTGIPTRVDGYRGRTVDFDLSLMSPAEYETNYSELRWMSGLTSPLMAVPNSKSGAFLHDRLLYGSISAMRSTAPYSLKFTQSFSFDSLI